MELVNTVQRDHLAVSCAPVKELPEIELVERALDIIEAVALNRRGLLARELSAKVGIRLSMGQTLLAALERRGYVDRDPRSKRYSAGTRLLELASSEPGRIRGTGPESP